MPSTTRPLCGYFLRSGYLPWMLGALLLNLGFDHMMSFADFLHYQYDPDLFPLFIILYVAPALYVTLKFFCDHRSRHGAFPGRLLVLPLAPRRLVAPPFLFAVGFAGAGFVLIAQSLKLPMLLNHQPIPHLHFLNIFPPALFCAALVGAVLAAWWALPNMWVRILAAFAIIFAFFYWFFAGLVNLGYDRYQFSLDETHALERLLLWGPMILCLSLLISVFAADCWRSGEPLLRIVFTRHPRESYCGTPALWKPRPPFSSPAAAQFWFEWRQRGFMLPVLVISILSIVATSMVATRGVHNDLPSTQDWILSFYAIPLLTLVYGSPILGVVFGTFRASSGHNTLDKFRATLPRRDAQLTSAILRSNLAGLLSAWLIFILAFCIPMVWLQLRGRERELHSIIVTDLPFISSFPRLFPVIVGGIVFSWIGLSLGTALSFTGRLWFAGMIIAAFLIGLIYVAVISEHLSGAEGALFLMRNSVASCAFAGGLISSAAIIAALRRHLHPLMLLVVPLISIAAIHFIYGGLTAFTSVHYRWPALVLLCVAPFAHFAIAPLALAWNRHR